MKPTTAKNIAAIFCIGANEIDRDILSSRLPCGCGLASRCRITGRTSRPINGFAVLYRGNLTDLWVWTDQRNRSTQSVHARVNLKDDDALAQLEAAGVEILAFNPDGNKKA